MAFPWVSLLVAVLSFILAKKNGASTAAAAGVAALAGVSTYAFARTDVGRKTIGKWDGVADAATSSSNVLVKDLNEDGTPKIGDDGLPVYKEVPAPEPSADWSGVVSAAPALMGAAAGAYKDVAITSAGVKAGRKVIDGIPPWALFVGGGFLLFLLLRR